MLKESKRDTIIREANKLFLEQGYTSTTLVDICTASDVSKTTFYYHFKSKEDILIHFYDTLTQDISNDLVSILSIDSYFEQLMYCFETLINEGLKYGTDFFSQMLITNLASDRGSFDFRDNLTNLALTIIKKGQESGELRSNSSPLELYKTSAYIFFGLQVTWCIKDGNFEWKNEMREALKIILKA